MADQEEPKEQQIIKQMGQLEEIRRDYEPLWEYVIDFVCPRRYNLDGTRNKGVKVGEKMFDGTASSALDLLASGLYGYLVSPSIRWFRLRMSRYGLDDVPEVAAWLEACEEEMYWAFSRSNFYQEILEFFIDGGSIGTATLYVEPDLLDNRIIFTSLHPGEVYIAENRYGMVDTIFRKYSLTVRKAAQEFGLEALPEAMRAAYSSNRYREFPFLHAVFPRNDVQMYFDGKSYRPKKNDKGKPFESVTIAVDGKKIVRDKGYRVNPFTVWRWRKNTEEVYARSPASDALVDILGMNQMERTMLTAGQMSVEPPWNVPEEMRGKVRIRPRGINYYSKQDKGIFPVNTGMDYPIGKDREDQKRQAIRDRFHVDFFLLLSRAAMEGQELRVQQIVEMQGEKAAMLGPVIGRLATECLDPIIDRVFQIEMDAGRLPPPPEVLYEFAGQPIEVDYQGPLAQAQKRMFHTQGVLQSVSAIAPIAQLKPRVLDNVDWDVVTREILEVNGMPQKAIVDPKVRDANRQREDQAQEQAAKMAMLDRAAEHLPALSKTVEPGSVLAQMAGTAAGGEAGAA